MVTSPLLSNVRHRAMISPVSPLRNKVVEPVLQIFGSACSSGHLIFLDPAPTSRNFWLQLRNNLVQKIRKKTLYYLYSSLPPQTTFVDPKPKFQVPVPPSKSFWLRLQPSKIASTPAPQLCCVLGSLILSRVAGQFIVRLKLFFS